MKKVKVWLGLLLSVGVLVALISFYEISFSETMNKLGLAKQELATMIVTDKLKITTNQLVGEVGCGLIQRVRSSLEFLLAGEAKKSQLSFRLAETRIKCGVKMMQGGKSEVGVYEVMKGLGYLQAGYQEVEDLGGVDLRVCQNLPDGELDSLMIGLVESLQGQVYQVVNDKWTEIKQMRIKVEEKCLDERELHR